MVTSNTKVVIAKELSDLMHLKPVLFAGFENAKGLFLLSLFYLS